MITAALMTAIICILAPIVIPVGPVPVSLATFVIMLAVMLLEYKAALACVVLYILLGTLGLPVFSGFSGGLAKIAGPTGGYIIGYIVLAAVAGLFARKGFVRELIGLIVGNILLYVQGTLWLGYQMGIPFSQALILGVVPFLIGDGVKIAAVMIVFPMIRKRLS